jgi:hypothetical protein
VFFDSSHWQVAREGARRAISTWPLKLNALAECCARLAAQTERNAKADVTYEPPLWDQTAPVGK